MIIQINNRTEYNKLGNYLAYCSKSLEGPFSHHISTIVFPLIVWYDDDFNYLAWQDDFYSIPTTLSPSTIIPLDAALHPDKHPEFFI